MTIRDEKDGTGELGGCPQNSYRDVELGQTVKDGRAMLAARRRVSRHGHSFKTRRNAMEVVCTASTREKDKTRRPALEELRGWTRL